VRSNLRLVVNIAKKYANRGMNLGDLIEEGNLGLLKAVDYYDPERGTRFSTYAAWWIKQSIKRALLSNIQPVHIPTYMVALINHWRRMAAELENKLGRPPEIKEMADAMQLPQRKSKIISDIVEILGSMRDTAGGDGADEGQMVEASLPTQGTARPEDSLIEDEEKAKALKMLGQIDPREAEIMKLHYGLDGNKPLTLKEIGEKLDLTRERIRQLQHSALTRLYECMNRD
jgi:RNA polymerase primary sigma factor